MMMRKILHSTNRTLGNSTLRFVVFKTGSDDSTRQKLPLPGCDEPRDFRWELEYSKDEDPIVVSESTALALILHDKGR